MIEKKWQSYAEFVYPDGMVPMQEEQIKRAFFAGCITLFAALDEFSNRGDPPAVAAREMIKLRKEIANTCDKLAAEGLKKSRECN